MASSIYLSLNEKPRVILDVMRRMRSEALRSNKGWNRGCAAVMALGMLGIPFVLVDMLLGFNGSTFTLVALLLWLLAASLAIYLLVAGRTRLENKKFDAAATIILNLRDDVSRKSRMTGWLDLTGPRQKSKVARTAYSSSGNRKVYYRDPWLQFKSKLADGNVLRLSIVEQQKVKKGAVAAATVKMKAKIVVDSRVYAIKPFAPQTGSAPGMGTVSVNNGVIEISELLSSREPDPWQVLNSLKAAYEHLEPAGYASYAGPGQDGSSPAAPATPPEGRLTPGPGGP